MKIVLTALTMLTLLSASAQAREPLRTVLAKEMPEDHCEAVIAAYSFQYNLERKPIGRADYVLVNQYGEREGNGYWSQGTCYIYRVE
jgi:hypothetical protein